MVDPSPSIEETLAGDSTLEGDSRPEPSRSPAPQRGTAIGRYLVLERIGRGGMGVVYAAYDPQLDRKVALKVLVPRHREDAEEAAQQRLVREAKAMARVSHPNVVAVHDVGLHEGQVFVAMEFVDGVTLGRWLEAEPRPPRQVLEVFAQAGRGLAAAHAKGLTHRDFKPDNVMVGHDGSEASVRAQVLDFGLVRESGVDEPVDTDTEGLEFDPSSLGPNDQTLTRLGQLMGTPAFMAPEQFHAGEVDTRTDQFSFCVALWSALYGQDPFGGDDLASRAGRVLAGERGEPPSSAGVSPKIRRALERGLQVERDERWPSMDALLEELLRDGSRWRRQAMIGAALLVGLGLPVVIQQVMHARAVQACQRTGVEIDESWNDEVRERARKSALATEAANATEHYERVESEIDEEVERWRQARIDACMASEVDERWDETRAAVALDCLQERRESFDVFMESLFGANREVLYNAPTAFANRPPPERCVDERYLAQQPAPLLDPERRAEYSALAPLFFRLHRDIETSALDDALEQLEILRPRVEALEHGPAKLRLLRLEVDLHQHARRFEQATELMRQAFAMALELGALEHAGDLAMAMAARSLSEGSLEDALWETQMAKALYRRIGEPEDGLRMYPVLHLEGWIHQRGEDFDGAAERVEQALAIGEAHLGADNPQLARQLCLLASIEVHRNEMAEAERLALRCVELREHTQGSGHPDVATALQVLGDVRVQAGRRDDAIEPLERALAISENAHTSGGYAVATASGNLGMALNDAGRYAEAKTFVERSVAIMETSGGDAYSLGLMLVNLGNARQGLQEHETACEAYLRALRLMEANPEAGQLGRAVVLNNLATSELALERFDDALTHQRTALELFEALYGSEHPQVVHALGNLASIQQRLGQQELALELFGRVIEVGERVLGPEHPDLSFPLVGSVDTLLALDRGPEALVNAERALSIRRSAPTPEQELAIARWYLARALRANDQDPARTQALAQEALTWFESQGHDQATDIRAFLAEEHDDEGDEDDDLETLDVDFNFDPFQADLDGDGRQEFIEWTCDETKVTLEIGKATFEAPLGFADLIGCGVAVVELAPGSPDVVLWLSADEHEEAGPDRNFVLRYRRGTLQKLWVKELDLDFYTDGSWRTETEECVEAERVYRTTTTIWRLVDGRVTHEDASEDTPLDPGEDCDYDPSEP